MKDRPDREKMDHVHVETDYLCPMNWCRGGGKKIEETGDRSGRGTLIRKQRPAHAEVRRSGQARE